MKSNHRYEILKDFKGSPDGSFAVQYTAGEIVELTDSLAEVALKEKWAKPSPRGKITEVTAARPYETK